MGLMDNLKTTAGLLKDKAGDLAQQHEDKIGSGLEKAARTVDEKTKGKYSSQIRTGTDKAKDALGRLSGSAGHPPDAGSADSAEKRHEGGPL
ncbi:antitoxin [Streptomyces sp. x-80]|uniref:antitoxin n=1 Tax=Streptomyces sp. x-80 TaxID=2789282 RepID=UPI003980040A